MPVTTTGGGGSQAGPWSPSAFSSALVRWHDWSTGLTKAAGNVSAWASGFGTSSARNATQATAGTRPATEVLSVGEVPLFAPNKYLDGGDLTALGLTAGTLIVRCRCDTVAISTEYLSTDIAIDSYADFGGANSGYPSQLRTTRKDGQPEIATGWFTIFIESAGGNWKRWVNGVMDINTSGTFDAGVAWRIGAGPAGVWQGVIAAVGLVNRTLSAGERTSATAYVEQATS